MDSSSFSLSRAQLDLLMEVENKRVPSQHLTKEPSFQTARFFLSAFCLLQVLKAVCMNQRVVSLGCCLKVFKKLLSVADALENRFSLLIPASGDMIKRNGKGNSQRPGHSPFPDHLTVDIRLMSNLAHQLPFVKCCDPYSFSKVEQKVG
jgi:hypothetical protein